MSILRHVEIKHFRAIDHLSWHVKPGLNCIIGPGDSGKSTVLDAIELVLTERQNARFSDADFHNLDVSEPIEITATFGELYDDLKVLEKFGSFHRGYDITNQTIHDEPQTGMEVVLSLRLTVDKNHDSTWQLYSERATTHDIERRLTWKHRETLAPTRLGTLSTQHLAWGNRSILNKLSEETINVSEVMATLSRDVRADFSRHSLDGVNDVLKQVKTIADTLGITVGDVQALLDVKAVSMSNGAISLHSEDGSPLRQLGTGSSRLLVSGLHKAASNSKLILVDEAEYGLEPFRITRLLNELGAKETSPSQQVFLTTHSPYVLRQLQASQLSVLRPQSIGAQRFSGNPASHLMYPLGGSDIEQSTLRACAESFLSRAVIVCEGKTEMGLIRGYDLYSEDINDKTIGSLGVDCANGDGDSMFNRAGVFKSLGYPTAILKDSDKPSVHLAPTLAAVEQGILVCEWTSFFATEDVLFDSCPERLIPVLLDLAIERKGYDAINTHILNHSDQGISLEDVRGRFEPNYRQVLASAANKAKWYKDIDPMEQIGRRIIGPNYADFDKTFTEPFNRLLQLALHQ